MIVIVGVALVLLLILCLACGDDWQSGLGSFVVIAAGSVMIWFLIDFLMG